MSDADAAMETISDLITGREVPNTGSEENRQRVEKYLVEEKGFAPTDIAVDAPIAVEIDGEAYRSVVDLVVSVGNRKMMVVKCAAGSLGSREREAVAAARLLLHDYRIPLAVVSDGEAAALLDTRTGKKISEGLASIPSREKLAAMVEETVFEPLPPEKIEREKLIYRTYDSMTVNRA